MIIDGQAYAWPFSVAERDIVMANLSVRLSVKHWYCMKISSNALHLLDGA